MFAHPGNHIGDTWYYIEDDAAHMFYLTCPDTVPRHTRWDIAHAISGDLINWERQGIAIHRGERDEWDYSCATGSVIMFQGRYWMAYTGNWRGPEPAVGLAVSDDLYVWWKCNFNPVTTIDTRYYEPVGSGTRQFPHWRDPFLFEHGGYIYHYVCASKNSGEPDARGTVGLARSTDMVQWEVLPPPELDGIAQELECPQLLSLDDGPINGRYFLIFSSLPELFSRKVQESCGGKLRHSTYCMVAESPFGPFRLAGPLNCGSPSDSSGPEPYGRVEPIIPADYPVQPYACQIVRWQGRLFLLGTVWNDAQDFVCDPIPINAPSEGLRTAGPIE